MENGKLGKTDFNANSKNVRKKNGEKVDSDKLHDIGQQNVEYNKLNRQFESMKEKDVNAQIVGTAFSYFLIIVGFLLLYLCIILFQTEIPEILVIRMVFVILIYIIVGLFERLRLKRISNWYMMTKARTEMLSDIQQSTIASLNAMVRISILNIVLSIAFLWVQWVNNQFVVDLIFKYELPLHLPNYKLAMNFYLFLMQLSRIAVFVYLMYLIWRLIVWLSRTNEFMRLEKTIQAEMPNLKELTDLDSEKENL